CLARSRAIATIWSATLVFEGICKLAVWKKASGNSGMSDVSICSSVSASILSQSVAEGFFIALALLAGGFSYGNNPNSILASLCIAYHGNAVTEHPNGE